MRCKLHVLNSGALSYASSSRHYDYNPSAIVWRCLRDPAFRRFTRTATCDILTDRHTTTAYTAPVWRRAVKMDMWHGS